MIPQPPLGESDDLGLYVVQSKWVAIMVLYMSIHIYSRGLVGTDSKPRVAATGIPSLS